MVQKRYTQSGNLVAIEKASFCPRAILVAGDRMKTMAGGRGLSKLAALVAAFLSSPGCMLPVASTEPEFAAGVVLTDASNCDVQLQTAVRYPPLSIVL